MALAAPNSRLSLAYEWFVARRYLSVRNRRLSPVLLVVILLVFQCGFFVPLTPVFAAAYAQIALPLPSARFILGLLAVAASLYSIVVFPAYLSRLETLDGKPVPRKGRMRIFVGTLIVVGGIGYSVLSYVRAGEGMTYLVATGAIGVGLALIVRGALRFAESGRTRECILVRRRPGRRLTIIALLVGLIGAAVVAWLHVSHPIGESFAVGNDTPALHKLVNFRGIGEQATIFQMLEVSDRTSTLQTILAAATGGVLFIGGVLMILLAAIRGRWFFVWLVWYGCAAMACESLGLSVFSFKLWFALLQGITPQTVQLGIAIWAGTLVLPLFLTGIMVIRFFYSFFTTVSVAGLALGTMMLVLILNIMGGFEDDLRDKTLGVKAHMRVERADGENMREYREIGKKLETVSGVVGQSPFYETEAILAFEKNPASVIVRGIDIKKSRDVIKLAEDIEYGSMERLWPLSPDGRVQKAEDREKNKGRGQSEPWDLGDPIDFSGESATPNAGADNGEPGDEAKQDEDPDDGFDKMPTTDFGEPDDIGVAVPLDIDDDERRRTNTLDGILVGRELAMQHEVFLDQRVTLVSPLTDISPAGGGVPTPFHREYRVAGQFYVGMVQFDLKYVYIDIESMREFLDLEDVATGIEMRVDDPDDTQPVRERIQAMLGDEYRVRDWQEIDRALFSALSLEKKTMFVVLVLAILVAAFSVLGNLIMIVVEKGREIAILKALGVSNGGVRRIFFLQGLEIGILGSGIGVSLGLLACALAKGNVPIPRDIWYISVLPVKIDLPAALLTFSAAVFVSALATIYPAQMAADLSPIRGIKERR